MADVRLSKLRKVYEGGVEAVRGVDLHAADGEFIVLVGPSGCGKTTTLRMVAGLEEISGGTVEIGGRVVNSLHPKDRDIAMVFQNYALYPHMTVRENMSFSLKMRRTPKSEIKRRVDRAAEMLGIGPLLDRRPRALSGGQKQRAAVGRAIVREPSAFLFDEPLSNLDAKLRVSMRTELKALHASLRTTTIYVTHDQEEAMTLGDRIVVMKSGEVQQIGAPLDVYERPANRFVAAFVGTPAMNIVDGVLESAPGGADFIGGNGAIRWRATNLKGLESHVGKPIALGIRPHLLSLARAEGDAGGAVQTVEPLGDREDVRVRIGGIDMQARIDAGSGLRPGDRASVSPRMDRAVFFEPGGDGRRIAANEGGTR